MSDFFRGPHIYQAIVASIGIPIVNFGFNDRNRIRKKKYVFAKLEIQIGYKPGDYRTWSDRSMDAIAEFLTHNDVYEDRVNIIEAQFHKDYTGVVRIECYLLESIYINAKNGLSNEPCTKA